MSPDKIEYFNSLIMKKLSIFLNLQADFIKQDMIKELEEEYNLSKEEAFSILLADVCDLDIVDNFDDRELYENYFPQMIHKLDAKKYQENPYYKNIKIENKKEKMWQLKHDSYKPYEAFVYNDLEKMKDGRLIPQIGFFDEEFKFPVVLENNREWMLITPNEIETMELPIKKAYGKVLTYGLGLGYFAYMTSLKNEVSSVTIVEKDENVINLFKTNILHQFEQKNKINIIKEDAFYYAENHMADENYDFVFTDLWHDPSDGVDMYLKMKSYEKLNNKSEYMYWIEKTILCYL